jgi:hypothetical protein
MRRAATTTALLALACAGRAYGFGAGVSGFSGKPPAQPCSRCHGGGPAPSSVTLSGPARLSPGQSATYTLDIVTGASTAHAGFDVATSAGTIKAIAGQPNESYIAGGELTHTKNWPQGETVQLRFELVAPSLAGPLTLYVNALQSDGVDDTGGDGTAGATLAVDVAEPADLAGVDLAGTPPPDLLPPPDAISSATEVKPTPQPAAVPPHNEPKWACDCRIGGQGRDLGAGAAALLAPLLLAARAWRRRRG